MSVFVEKYILPIDREEYIVSEKMQENGGDFGYIDNPYPCGIFAQKELARIDFAPLTIFYGGNGSGKSTLLNIIASKLNLRRIAPYSTGETFGLYVKYCSFEYGTDDGGWQYRVPNGSSIITSDDVFDYMLTVRTNNDDITENKEYAREDHYRLMYGETVKFRGMEDYEELRLQVLARRKSVSRRQFIRKTAGGEVRLNSNGETALAYFNRNLRNDTLYCLDEPENSLSPKLQMSLVKTLEELVRYCGCQLIIATHSPFILSIPGAKIYDLDETPVDIKKWWELENVKVYYDFFYKNRKLFGGDEKP